MDSVWVYGELKWGGGDVGVMDCVYDFDWLMALGGWLNCCCLRLRDLLKRKKAIAAMPTKNSDAPTPIPAAAPALSLPPPPEEAEDAAPVSPGALPVWLPVAAKIYLSVIVCNDIQRQTHRLSLEPATTPGIQNRRP